MATDATGLTLGQQGFDTSRSWLEQVIHGLQWFVSPGKGDFAGDSDALYMMIYWWSLFWFFLLMGLTVYWVIKYRRRPGVPAQPSASHNTPLEIIWTVVPSSSLVVIFLLGFWGYLNKTIAGPDSVLMNLTAKKWGWTITYPNGVQSGTWLTRLNDTAAEEARRAERARVLGVAYEPPAPPAGTPAPGTPGSVVTTVSALEYPVMVFPAGKNVQLKMVSTDVIHSFWIPALRKKIDVMPNRNTSFTFQTPPLGEDALVGEYEDGSTYRYQDYWIFCAEYCGQDHSEMAAVLRVVSDLDYTKITQEIWADVGLLQRGENIYKGQCASCHSLDGSRVVGPSWKDLWGNPVPLTTGETLSFADNVEVANYIREAILYPNNKKRAGYEAAVMNSFQGLLSDEDLLALELYMATLSTHPLAAQFVQSMSAPEGAAPGADGAPTQDAGPSSDSGSDPAAPAATGGAS